MNHIKNAKWFTSNIINEISQKLQIKNIKNLKSFCYLKTHKRMIQKKTWHEYSNELKQFLCEVAMSRWARYLYYPLGVFIAIMYTTSQAGAHPHSLFSLICEFAGCIMVIVLCTIIAVTCILTADLPYDRLRRRNKARDIQRVVEAFRVAYDKETELRMQRENELVRRQVILECHKQH